jgi:hypothetical protein
VAEQAQEQALHELPQATDSDWIGQHSTGTEALHSAVFGTWQCQDSTGAGKFITQEERQQQSWQIYYSRRVGIFIS